jgi:hypothetical protein
MKTPVEVKMDRPYNAISISTNNNVTHRKEVIVESNIEGYFIIPGSCLGILLESIKLSKIDVSVLRLLQNGLADSIEENKESIEMFLRRPQVQYLKEIVAKRMEHCENEKNKEVKYVWEEENEMKFRYKFDPATYIEMKLLYFELKDWLSLTLA